MNSILKEYIKTYRRLNERRTIALDQMIDYIVKNELTDEEIFETIIYIEMNEVKARKILTAIKSQIRNKVKPQHDNK